MKKRASQKCVDSSLKLWNLPAFNRAFLGLHRDLFDDGQIHNLFRDTLQLFQLHCDGKSSSRPSWPKTGECVSKFMKYKGLPGYEESLRKFCKAAKVKYIDAFEIDFINLIAYYCWKKNRTAKNNAGAPHRTPLQKTSRRVLPRKRH